MLRLQYLLYFFFATGAVVGTTQVLVPLVQEQIAKNDVSTKASEQKNTPVRQNESSSSALLESRPSERANISEPVAQRPDTKQNINYDRSRQETVTNDTSPSRSNSNESYGGSGSFSYNSSNAMSEPNRNSASNSIKKRPAAVVPAALPKKEDDKDESQFAGGGSNSERTPASSNAAASDSSGSTLSQSATATKIIVTSVSSTATNGSYKAGDVIPITITFSKIVTVTGTPQITLETGTTDRTVNYFSGSGTTILTFNYTVQAGDTSADLDYTSTTALALNGGVIADASGRNADLTLVTPSVPYSLGANKALVIDTTSPNSATSLTWTQGSLGPSPSTASWTKSSSTDLNNQTLQFYQSSNCGTGTESGSIVSLSSASTQASPFSGANAQSYTYKVYSYDLAGNSAVSTCSSAILIDSVAPTLALTKKIGQSAVTPTLPIEFTVTFSEPINAASFTASDISNSGTATGVTWTITSVSSTVYTVTATASSNGTLAPIIAAGSVSDTAGNSNAAAATSSDTITYDTVAPTAPSALTLQTPSASPGNVTTPTIRVGGVSIGDTIKLFTNIGCTTQVGSSVVSTGTTVDVTASTLTDATYVFYANSTDTAGNISTCSTATVTYVLDTTSPSVTNVTSTTANGSYKAGGNIAIQITFSKAVTVTGTPQLTLETGATDELVNYSSGSGTATLTFNYTVQSGDNSNDLDYTNSTSLALNSGSIKDAAGNNATLTLFAPSSAGSLAANKALVIDTTAPSLPTLALQTPATSPNISAAPVIRASAVANGDIVTLYSDSSCTTAASAATPSSGTTVDVTSNSLPSYGNYTYYAKSIDPAGNISACSTSYADYTYTDLPTVQFSASTQSFNDNQGSTWDASMNAWSKKIKLTFQNGSNSETVTNFPVLVVLNSSRVSYADFKANGDDIRFLDSNGNLLSYEIETWNTSGTSYIWVKVPTITGSSNSDYINMYYKNTDASAGQNATGAWNSNYAGVWHFDSGFSDSTSNGNTGTNSGTTQTTSAKLINGRTFNGSATISMGTGASLQMTGALTIEAWVKRGNTGGDQKILSNESSGGYKMALYGNCIELEIQNSGGGIDLNRPAACPNGVTSTTAWTYVVATYSQSAGKILTYLNGAADRTYNTSIVMGASTGLLRIGSEYSGGNNYFGDMDELRISNTARSAGWIATTYKAVNDTLISYGSIQSQPQGVVTLTVNSSFSLGSNITIPFTVSGTAVNPTDHNLASGSITITAGQTTGSTTFNYFRNSSLTTDRTIVVTMGTPTNATTASPSAQTVTLVGPGNSAPTLSNDSVTVTANSSNNSFSVLTNDSDGDGDAFYISNISAASHGTVVNNLSSITYTPVFEYSGSDSFTYTVTDIYGATSTATVNITVAPSPFTWTGAAGNNIWSTAGNWYGNAAPGTTDVAHFSSSLCTGSNCNVSITSNLSVGGVSIGGSYAGQLRKTLALL